MQQVNLRVCGQKVFTDFNKLELDLCSFKDFANSAWRSKFHLNIPLHSLYKHLIIKREEK